MIADVSSFVNRPTAGRVAWKAAWEVRGPHARHAPCLKIQNSGSSFLGNWKGTTRNSTLSRSRRRGATQAGDTLAVRFDRHWPNRDRGWSRIAIAPNLVEPWHIRKLPKVESSAEWEVDRERGTATLLVPETKLGRLTLPLAPMLGCFGVAPAHGEAISTATSGRHGGNMDYRGFRTGVAVSFPVLVPGALLHVGDGHALQGDGEIVGTGIEISFDVQFTVDLRKGKWIGWPRAEIDQAGPGLGGSG
jgi:amidase